MTRPIPLVMCCPHCGAGHVDLPPWDTRPHHEHLCSACGKTFEALDSDVPTVGVRDRAEEL